MKPESGNIENDKLRRALVAVEWTAKHDCHLEQTIERVVKLRNDVVEIAHAALGTGDDDG